VRGVEVSVCKEFVRVYVVREWLRGSTSVSY